LQREGFSLFFLFIIWKIEKEEQLTSNSVFNCNRLALSVVGASADVAMAASGATAGVRFLFRGLITSAQQLPYVCPHKLLQRKKSPPFPPPPPPPAAAAAATAPPT
jgi:hypothetical protein